MDQKKKIIFCTTIPLSLRFFQGQLSYLKTEFEVFVASSPGEELDRIEKREGVTGFRISMKREISIFKDIISLLKFIILLSRIRPDIIHGNTPKGALLSMLAGYITKIPVRIYMCHGLRYQGSTGLKRRLLIVMEKITCFCATSVLCVSEGVKYTLEQENISGQKSKVILNGSANGIDTLKFSPLLEETKNKIREEYKISLNTFVFTFVGRIVADKGINELVSAFNKLSSKYPEVQLNLIGDYDNGLNPISAETKLNIRLNPQIITFGFRKDIHSFIGISDTLVLPSYREGFGLVLMEAAAMSVPVITSDIIGCNNVVTSDNGILVNPKDENDLYKKMEMIYLDNQLRKGISMNTRNSIKARFEQTKVWEAYKEEYLSYVQ